jgi:hypothetical protein
MKHHGAGSVWLPGKSRRSGASSVGTTTQDTEPLKMPLLVSKALCPLFRAFLRLPSDFMGPPPCGQAPPRCPKEHPGIPVPYCSAILSLASTQGHHGTLFARPIKSLDKCIKGTFQLSSATPCSVGEAIAVCSLSLSPFLLRLCSMQTSGSGFFFFKFLFYSYVHIMLGSFLPLPHPLPYPPSPLSPPHPLDTQQKLFCPYL